MHRVWKHLCLARRRNAWYALGRQRDSSPAGADVLAPTCVGVFFMAGYTGHKKDPISFEAGLAPSSSPRGAISASLPHPSGSRDQTILPGCTGHKKDPISFEAGLAPSSSPAALYPLPCRILLAVETKQFCPVAPVIKRRISFEAGLAPSSSPAALYHLCFHHNRRTDSKKSTLPKQSALRLGCSVLAG